MLWLLLFYKKRATYSLVAPKNLNILEVDILYFSFIMELIEN